MSRLSPEAEQLVRAGRSVLRASDADRERVLSGLLPKLGGGAGIEQASTELHRAPAAGKLSAAKVSSMIVALGIAGTGIFLALRSEPQANVEAASPAMPLIQQASAPAIPEPTLSLSEVPPSEVAPSEVSAPEPPSPQTIRSEAREVVRARAPVKPRSADNLAREVALLSRAGVELHADRPAAALEALDEHQRTFPRGVLAEERAAAKVRALCALGRMKEAQVEVARLTRTSPGSPHLARAVQSCSFTPSEGK